MKFAPSIQQAYKRRHWLLTTSIVENILFSAVLLGWPALVSVLKNEGFNSNLCNVTNIVDGKSTIQPEPDKSTAANISKVPDDVNLPLSWTTHSYIPQSSPLSTRSCCSSTLYPSCSEQEKKLNLCFTVGTFLLSALTLPITVAADKFGTRLMRILGGIIAGVSAILFACSSSGSPNILFFACALNGIGGNVIAFTSLQVSNLFGQSRSTILGLLIGSYAAAAIVFPVMKVLYALGASIQLLFAMMAISTLGVILNAWINIPIEPIPRGLNFTQLADPEYSAFKFVKPTEVDPGKDNQSPTSDIVTNHNESSDDFVIMGLHRVVFMPVYLWSLLVISITQLRLLFFVGDLQQLLAQLAQENPETVDLYVFIFGILQICCLGTTHFIGGFVDWKTRTTTNNVSDEDTHLLSRQAATTNRAPKPIPSSSTTTSFLVEKVNGSESTTVPPTPMSTTDHSETRTVLPATHPTVPPMSTSLPATPVLVLGVPQQVTPPPSLPDTNSDTFYSVRKSSLVHLVNEGGSKKVSLVTSTLPSTPERRNRQSLHATKELEYKIQRLKDSSTVLFVTSFLTVIFGLLVLIPALTIQISTFVCYTLIRGFVPCVIGRLYGVAFHPVHQQTLIGLSFLLSALFCVLQHPLFALTMDYFNGDPYWVNVGLLAASSLCFCLPIHLLYHCNRLEEWRKATAGPPQPVLIKMQYLDTKLTNRGKPTDL